MCRRNQKWLNVGMRRLITSGNRATRREWEEANGCDNEIIVDDPVCFEMILAQNCYGRGGVQVVPREPKNFLI